MDPLGLEGVDLRNIHTCGSPVLLHFLIFKKFILLCPAIIYLIRSSCKIFLKAKENFKT